VQVLRGKLKAKTKGGGDLARATPPRGPTRLLQIAVRAEPLLDQRGIALPVRRSGGDRIGDDGQPAIKAAGILGGKEGGDVALDIAGGELAEGDAQEALEHDEVAAQRGEHRGLPVRLDVRPQRAAAARVRRQRQRAGVPVLHRHRARERECQQVVH